MKNIIIPPDASKGNKDNIMRSIFNLNRAPNSNFVVYRPVIILSNTDTNQHVHLQKVVEVMREAISSFKKTMEYNGHYNAYLLGQLSEEEFAKISENFSITLNQEPEEIVKDKTETLIKYTGETFTPSEISNIFGIDEIKSEKILQDIDNFLCENGR